jgi:hypothetical protein
MPIRLNLLAEAQAAEEMRRRDPVKRAIWASGLFIAAMLTWSSLLQLRVTLAKSELTKVQGQIGSQSAAYKAVAENQKKAAEINQRLNSLRELASARLLYGTFLNAFQKTTVEDVQLLHLKTDQTYAFTDAVKTRTNDNNVVIKGKPATSTERIVVTIEGNDASSSNGDQVGKFKDALANGGYFKAVLAKTNGVSLKSISAPQISPNTGKSCVMFALECRYPETTR